MNQWGSGILGLIAHGIMAPAFDYEDDSTDIVFWYMNKHGDQRDLKSELKTGKVENKKKIIRKLAAV